MKETGKSVLQQCIVGVFLGMLVAIPSSGEAMPPQQAERVSKHLTQTDVSQPGRPNSANCLNTSIKEGALDDLPPGTLYGIRQSSQDDGTPASLFYDLLRNLPNLTKNSKLSFKLGEKKNPVEVYSGHDCGDSGSDPYQPAHPIEF